MQQAAWENASVCETLTFSASEEEKQEIKELFL